MRYTEYHADKAVIKDKSLLAEQEERERQASERFERTVKRMVNT